LTFTEENSRILDLVNVRPETITIEGSAVVGDEARTVTVEPEDTIRGRFRLSAPFRVRIHDAAFEPDPFELEIDEDLRERIEEDLIGAEARAIVSNRLPFAVTVVVRFASDSSRVHASPEIELAPVRVESAFIDPASGRAMAQRVTEARLEIGRSDVPFFAGGSVFSGVLIRPDSVGGRPVEVMTTDWVEVGGTIRFALELSGP
jgi:hypothetical protein